MISSHQKLPKLPSLKLQQARKSARQPIRVFFDCFELGQATTFALNMLNERRYNLERLPTHNVWTDKFVGVVYRRSEVTVETMKSTKFTMTEVTFIRDAIEGQIGSRVNHNRRHQRGTFDTLRNGNGRANVHCVHRSSDMMVIDLLLASSTLDVLSDG